MSIMSIIVAPESSLVSFRLNRLVIFLQHVVTSLWLLPGTLCLCSQAKVVLKLPIISTNLTLMIKCKSRFLVLYVLCVCYFIFMVNSHGHVRAVSLPNHTVAEQD